MQYGRANIRCNAVAPGFIRTEAALSLPQQFIDGYVRHLPMKRLGEVEDIANAVIIRCVSVEQRIFRVIHEMT